MLEFLFELVFQFLFEVVAEFLFEAGFKGAARVLRLRSVRYGLTVVVGFGFGVWWGDRLSGGHRPSLFWVSLAVAVVAGIGALRRRADMAPPGEESAVAELRRLADTTAPEPGRSWRTSIDPRQGNGAVASRSASVSWSSTVSHCGRSALNGVCTGALSGHDVPFLCMDPDQEKALVLRVGGDALGAVSHEITVWKMEGHDVVHHG